MIIGGLQKFSMLDYPGHLAAIIFTQGCNFRCRFCYNPMLVWPTSPVKSSASAEGREAAFNRAGADELPYTSAPLDPNSGAEVFDFLRRRAGRLEGVVITGGEPTIHPDLPEYIRAIRTLGYKVKLDTNGTNPEMLRRLIADGLVDYIAMDIKSSPARYSEATGVEIHPVKSSAEAEGREAAFHGVNLENIKKSVKIVMTSGLPYEFRTTVVPSLVAPEDIAEIGRLIESADKWYLQQFKSDTELVDKTYENSETFRLIDLEEMKKIASAYVRLCEVR